VLLVAETPMAETEINKWAGLIKTSGAVEN
jgi:hypothetical protein